MNALKRKVDDSGRKLHEEIHADIGKLQRELEAKQVETQALQKQHQQETQALKGQLDEVLRILHSNLGVSGGGVSGGARV